MRKALAALAVASMALFASAAPSSAFTGMWYYENDPDYSEILLLGDNSDGTMRRLIGTERFCGRPGDSYASIRRVLHDTNDFNGLVDWRIANECDGGYIRVCVRSPYGDSACSTYEDFGWQ